MLITIAEILDKATLQRVLADIDGLSWRDGAATAAGAAKQVKRNLQADMTSEAGRRIANKVMAMLEANRVLTAAAQPRQFSRLMISKTNSGGGYGLHSDNAMMGPAERRLRTDLSFTLFLSDPDTYRGGELAIEFAGATQTYKPAAGDLVLYPSSTLHQVNTVTGGERLVCIGWIESLVRDANQREVLFDLQNLRTELMRSHGPGSIELLTLTKSISNLLRLWAQV